VEAPAARTAISSDDRAAARQRFASQATAQQHALLRSVDAPPAPPAAKYATSPSAASVRSGEASFSRDHGGAPITDLQDRLNAAGASPQLAEDGKFGPRTQQAVENFQRTRNLPVTGQVDQATLAALETAQPPARPDVPSSPATPPGGTGPIDPATLPRTGNAFMDSIAADAIRTQRETGVPASVTMAQAMIESGSGRSGLTRRANNYFGIKGTGPAGSVTMPTREVVNGQNVMVDARFRAYHNAQESFTDHANLLANGRRYQTAMSHRDDAEQFARDIHAAGYATDPNYSTALINTMRRYDLARFDAIGRQPAAD